MFGSLKEDGSKNATMLVRFPWKGVLSRLGYVAGCLCLVVFLGANKACRENYFFGTQERINDPTPTPGAGTPTATPTRTPRGGTQTPTATPDPDADETPTPTPAPIATRTATPQSALPLSLLNDLARASEPTPDPSREAARATRTPYPGQMRGIPGARSGTTENWLGNLFNPQDKSEGSTGRDRVVVVGENAEYQRSVGAVLKGLGFQVVAATEEIELEDAVEEEFSVAVLDASARELAVCDAASEMMAAAGGRRVGFVVVGASESGTFACGGKALGETVARPVTRLAMMHALERVTGRKRALNSAEGQSGVGVGGDGE